MDNAFFAIKFMDYTCVLLSLADENKLKAVQEVSENLEVRAY